MALTDRDVSILTQVAFKGAIEMSKGEDILDSSVSSLFEAKVLYLTDTLVSAVEVATEKHAKSVAAPVRQPAAAAAEADPNDPNEGITVVETKDGNGQNGALPAWFKKAAKAANVTKVFDNRHRLAENDKLPWFKDADEKDGKPFWPPKGK